MVAKHGDTDDPDLQNLTPVGLCWLGYIREKSLIMVTVGVGAMALLIGQPKAGSS